MLSYGCHYMNTTYSPSWKKHEEAIYKGDAKTQREASDKFIAERDHAIKTDPKAKAWEEARRAEAAKNKPLFVKEKKAKDREELDKMKSDLRQFGSSDMRLLPAPGYILVEPEVKEERTASGIILPEAASTAMTNKGTVVEIGREGITNDGREVQKPCEKDDLVLFKKGAGVEMEIQGRKCRFIQFSDILGVFAK